MLWLIDRMIVSVLVLAMPEGKVRIAWMLLLNRSTTAVAVLLCGMNLETIAVPEVDPRCLKYRV
jgi:predicted small integral membrane protein